MLVDDRDLHNSSLSGDIPEFLGNFPSPTGAVSWKESLLLGTAGSLGVFIATDNNCMVIVLK